MSKLAIVFPVLNQFPLAQTAIDFAINNLSGDNDVELIVIDNGSDTAFTFEELTDKAKVRIHHIKNIGVYPIFWEALKYTDADVLAFFHSDLIISEKGWDTRVLKVFDNPNVGMIGFVGSNEIDNNGGRGIGTTSNFQGLSTMTRTKYGEEKVWTGSPASAHGMTNAEYTKAAVVDGCAMVFRRWALEHIKQRENFPPHHFYDRLLSCEVRELGYEMGVLGIGCDHISGQSVNGSKAYEKMAEEWATAHGLSLGDRHNWDSVIYQEAEKQWITEYRENKHFIPCRV